MSKKISIAIDGPAAAGKSTVAKIVAKKLGYVYIDTGAMYRALTFKAIQNNIDVNNEMDLSNLLSNITIKLIPEEGTQKVFIDDVDVSEPIRTPEVTRNVSFVAKHSLVREKMVDLQREYAVNGGVVMDGRDIGTHVLVGAEVKIFMIASVDERAQRRHIENVKNGFESDLEQLKIEIATRDRIDSEREVSPLKKADDAISLDTTSKNIDDVVNEILTIVEDKIKNI
ncbi:MULTISPECIES: (d)CMP kinase [Bacillaceae]|uniref:Cytidylate kinase n=1 Tax=Gottfriedia luciferensis TaxID=178774 RepID=A0ABX2ZVG5_9BACI|nr:MULTISPECIES: (d)CMP kinase [Bacillaceae]ODG93662.1 cytidylate kinase [Gottfriedia luciferensis]PGZ91097.1 (d)CMP kinase [Bacillus sp. AFS029533]SFC24649.1 cytidylate kinase [Bacillus sp. UNCCL81]